ncbi:hypothetical protein Dimus_020298 [Dionaea muscipula]
MGDNNNTFSGGKQSLVMARHELRECSANAAATTTSTTSTVCFEVRRRGSSATTTTTDPATTICTATRGRIGRHHLDNNIIDNNRGTGGGGMHGRRHDNNLDNGDKRHLPTEAVYGGYAASSSHHATPGCENRDATIENTETQAGRIADLLESRAHGTLPSNTENNPRADLEAIELERRKVLQTNIWGAKEDRGDATTHGDNKRSRWRRHDTNTWRHPLCAKKTECGQILQKFLDILKLEIDIPFLEAIARDA